MMNQKVKLWMITISIFWITAFFQMISEGALTEESQVITAFASTNAKMVDSTLEITAEWKEEIPCEESKKVFLAQMAEKIGWNGEYEIIKEVRNNQVIWYLPIKRENMDAIIEMISPSKKNKNYCYLELKVSEQVEDILKYKALIENVFEQLGIKEYQTVLKFYGEYPGQLSQTDRSYEIKHLFKSLDAKVISEIKEKGIYSVYGYTRYIKDYIEVFCDRVNLNVAFTYNEEKNITNIYLATPILSGDY